MSELPDYDRWLERHGEPGYDWGWPVRDERRDNYEPCEMCGELDCDCREDLQ